MKKSLNAEIDILEVFSIIWSRKYQILLINILFIFFGLIFYANNKTSEPITDEINYKIKLKIEPISVFEEFEFSDYNYYVNGRVSLISFLGNLDNNLLKKKIYEIDFDRNHAILLDRKALYNYFIHQLKDKDIFKNELINFFDNYNQYQKYTDKENIIDEITQSIEISPNDTDIDSDIKLYYLETKIKGIDENSIKVFFSKYEKLINNNLKSIFIEKFNRSVKATISKIDNEINRLNYMSLNVDNLNDALDNLEDTSGLEKKELIFYLDYLKKQKQLENDKSIKVLEDSPLISKNFTAGTLDLSAIEIKRFNVNKTYTIEAIVLSSIFFASIISILYFLFIHAYRKKFQKK